jgi:hypothetical protein
MKSLSRRSILYSAISVPVFAASGLADEKMADAGLVSLGRQFDALAAEVDHSIEHAPDINMDTLEKFSQITAEILTIQAKTIDGLNVKARAACWALLGDLDPTENMTLDRSMALSIVRDLICLHNPSLERPGALKDLVKDIEDGASLPPAA